jgi:plastocyanin
MTSLERVKIVNFAFKPKTITIAKGTKVRWTNRGSANHTTTSNKGLWDSGVLAPGASFGRVFRKVGTFKYHCTIHPTLMHGKIVVT